ncbi:MAG: hypothetical protein ABII97_01060 [Patescibacteria group bacterium]
MFFEQVQPILGYLAGILVPATTIIYIVSVLRKQIVPSRTTWTVWTFLAVVLAVSMYVEGVLNPQVMMVAIGDLIVVSLAIKYGKWTGTRLDFICDG